MMRRHILIAALVLGLTLPGLAQGSVPQPVYFWSDVVATISAPGQPSAPQVIRPSAIGLTADGSADVEHLQWTGWGSSVAHATGISSASNGIPNMAQGKRIMKPAQVTLSNPGLFQGHEVYRCFTLTVPPAAASQPACLTDRGGYWGLTGTAPTGTTTPQPTTARTATSAAFFSPIRNLGLSCSIEGVASKGLPVGLACESQIPPRSVSMGIGGQLTICSVVTATNGCVGNPGIGTPTLAYGQHVTFGPFRCLSQLAGVTCTVTASGKGFLIGRAGITPVGGATVTVQQRKTPKQEAVMFSPLAYGLSCNMTDDGSSGGSWVYCWIGASSNPTRHVKLTLDGQLSLTATTAIPTGLGGRSTPYGGQVTAGRFRCQSLPTAIRCTVLSSGKGFLFNSAGITPVGP